MTMLAISMLRGRWAGLAGAFAAVLLGVVFATACGVLLESALRTSIHPERYTGASVVVRADPNLRTVTGSGADRETDTEPLPAQPLVAAGLADRLRTVPGVRAAIPDRSFEIALTSSSSASRGRGVALGLPADAWGHGWESAALTPFRLRSGSPPSLRTDVVIDDAFARSNRVRVGDHVRIALASGAASYTVTGIAGPAIPTSDRAVFFATAEAARLSGDRVAAIGVLAQSSRDTQALARDVRQALPGLDVLTGDDRGQAEFHDRVASKENAVALFSVFGGFAATIAVFVVASTFAFSVVQRRREFGLLRAVGAKPRQVLRMVSGEAFVIAVVAAAVGVPLGLLLAGPLSSVFGGLHLLPYDFHLYVGWIPALAGAGIALVSTQLAAYAAARRASRTRPTEALREAALERRAMGPFRWLAGLLALSGGVALLVLSMSIGGDSGASASIGLDFALMFAAVLLAPAAARIFSVLAGGLVATAGRTTGALAQANLRASVSRLSAAGSPVILAVSLASTMLFITSTQTSLAERQTAQRTTAEYVISGTGAVGVPADLVDRVRKVPGVAGVSAPVSTKIISPGDGIAFNDYDAAAVNPATFGPGLDLRVTSGRLTDLTDNAVAVSSAMSRSNGWHVGSTAVVRLADGARKALRVTAIYDLSYGFADFIVTQRLLDGHIPAHAPSNVFVAAAPGTDRGALGAALRSALADRPEAAMLTGMRFHVVADQNARMNAVVNYTILVLLVGYAAIAIVNTLAMAAAARVPEFALLRLVGATRAQVRRMMRWETLLVVVFGALLGSVISAATLMAFSYGLTGSIVPVVPLWQYGLVLGIAALLGFAANMLPMRLALRVTPIQAVDMGE